MVRGILPCQCLEVFHGSFRPLKVVNPPHEECAERRSLFAGGLGVSPIPSFLSPKSGGQGVEDGQLFPIALMHRTDSMGSSVLML